MNTLQTVIKVIFYSPCLWWVMSCHTTESSDQSKEPIVAKMEPVRELISPQQAVDKYKFLSAGGKISAMKKDAINAGLEVVNLPLGLTLGMDRKAFDEIMELLIAEKKVERMALSKKEAKGYIGTREYKFKLTKISPIVCRMHADFLTSGVLARLRMDYVLEDRKYNALFKNRSEVELNAKLEICKNEIGNAFYLKYDDPTVNDVEEDKYYAWFWGRSAITLEFVAFDEVVTYYTQYETIPLAFVWYEDLKRMNVFHKEQEAEKIKK